MYRPTPAQIRRECEAIRAAWSPAVRVSRIVDDATRAVVTGELPTTALVSLDGYDRAAWGG